MVGRKLIATGSMWEDGPIPGELTMFPGYLLEKTTIDPSSMVVVIDELEAKGLAERRPDPNDRRARAIFLTARGLQTLERVRALAGELQREFFAALSAEERDTLFGLLRKLAGSVE
jgi:DNA-binding MarR family transcriptional regulator